MMTGILIVALVAVSIGVVATPCGQSGAGGAQYGDADDDGVCDNIGVNGRDSDDGGVPNGKDDDYEPP